MTRSQKIKILQLLRDGEIGIDDVRNLEPQVYMFFQTDDKTGFTDNRKLAKGMEIDGFEDGNYISNSDFSLFEQKIEKQNVWREKIGLEKHRIFCVVYESVPIKHKENLNP
ncbi:MAG: hypothetical protein ACK4XL_09490 [Bacteroidota bacterium]|jgi:hypothetical protein